MSPASERIVAAAPLCLRSDALAQWRSFDVFEKSRVGDGNGPPEVFRSPNEISTVASGQSLVVVADIHGGLTTLNASFEPVKTWRAFVDGRATHARFAEAKGILVTLGVRTVLL